MQSLLFYWFAFQYRDIKLNRTSGKIKATQVFYIALPRRGRFVRRLRITEYYGSKPKGYIPLSGLFKAVARHCRQLRALYFRYNLDRVRCREETLRSVNDLVHQCSIWKFLCVPLSSMKIHIFPSSFPN